MMISFRKQENRTEHIKKKLHQVKEKTQRHSQEKKYQFEFIQTMTSQDLLEFINNRYDHIASRNQSMQLQMGKSILVKIRQLKIEFIAKHKKELFDFVIGGGGQINDQIYNGLLNHVYPRPSPKFWKCKFFHQNNIVFVTITFKNRTGDGNSSQLFYCCPFPEQINDQIHPKRIKKAAILFLEEFLRYEQKIAEII